MLFICYPKCTTCQKARKWLDEQGAAYQLRDIKTQRPTQVELADWYAKSGLPLKRFFTFKTKWIIDVRSQYCS